MEWERQRAYDYDDGKEAGKVEAATNALKMDLSVEQVATITGLPLEKVLELRQQLAAPAQA